MQDDLRLGELLVSQAEIHKMVLSNSLEDRRNATGLLLHHFAGFSDKELAWQDIQKLIHDDDNIVRKSAMEVLGAIIIHIPDKDLAWRNLFSLTQDREKFLRGYVGFALGAAFPHVPDKYQAWNDLHKLTLDEDNSIREGSAFALAPAFLSCPDKTQALEDLHRLSVDMDKGVREGAAFSLGQILAKIPDRNQVYEDLHQLTQDKEKSVRRMAIFSLASSYPHLPNKILAWQDIHKLSQDCESTVRECVAVLLGPILHEIPDKIQGWGDLFRLIQDDERNVQDCAIKSLRSGIVLDKKEDGLIELSTTVRLALDATANKETIWKIIRGPCLKEDGALRWFYVNTFDLIIPCISDRSTAWMDFQIMLQDKNCTIRGEAAYMLGSVFSYVPDKSQAQKELHRLTQDEDKIVRWFTAESIGSALADVPDKSQLWDDLHDLTFDDDKTVRWGVAKSLVSAFSYNRNREQVINDLLRLSHDPHGFVRSSAYYSLGHCYVSKASEANNIGYLKEQLADAVNCFDKSLKESSFSKSSFCHPFYRSYLAIISGEASENEVQNYLRDASKAIGESKSKKELFNVVENLARALKEANKLKDRPLHEISSELSTYSWYCKKAAEHMAAVESNAPVAVRLMRKANPILDERIQAIIAEIQEAARQICQLIKDKGNAAEVFCVQIDDAARSLSDKDFIKILNSISDIIAILKTKAELLSEGQRDFVWSQLEAIDHTGELPLKLDGIRQMIKVFLSHTETDDEFLRRLMHMDEKLNGIHDDIKRLRPALLDRFELNERKMLSSVIERLNKDKLEIVRILLDAVEENRVSKDLIGETLDGTKEMISEIREMQIEIKDASIGKSLSGLEDLIESPELAIENKLKVTIPIIPLLLTYEGTYNFKNSMKLDAAWTKLTDLFQFPSPDL